jgi:uncharacterized protein (DUF2236 family)
MARNLKDRVVATTTGLFSHGPRPLEHTLDHLGDPGLLGPDSVSWAVIGDSTAFVGGIRALLIQTAHPEVVAGVDQHSTYRSDPLGRLTRTSLYVTETTYGSCPEVEAAVATVRRAHVPVRGRSERDRAYSAATPRMAAWVHNVLTDSFLVAYQTYGPRRLTDDEADRFVEEQARIGRLLDADPLPTTAPELAAWIDEHPDVASSGAQQRSLDFLRRPPLSAPVRAGYRLLSDAAIATLPPRIAEVSDLHAHGQAERVGRAAVGSLRWALGASPAWRVSLIRSGAPVPPGLFRQPLSPEAQAIVDERSSDASASGLPSAEHMEG